MKCRKCGHTHPKNALCQNSVCSVCGLGGNLTKMTCEEGIAVSKQLEEMLSQKRGRS